MKFAGILALFAAVANLLLGSFIFHQGFAGAAWCVFETPVPDTPNPLIPLLYEVGVAACGAAGGIALLRSRGPAVLVACAILLVAGFALFIPKNIYSQSVFGPLAEDYARYGLLLVVCGLIGTTLPGVIGGLSIARRYLLAHRRRAATT